jgi:hypothetical protein
MADASQTSQWAAAMGSLDLSFETVGLDSGFCAHREGKKIYR